MSHHTYHDRYGRFTKKEAAATVTKDGERFKVVRQYRRVKKSKTGEKAAKAQRKTFGHEKMVGFIESARAKASRARSLIGRDYVSVAEASGVVTAHVSEGRGYEGIVASTPGKFVLSKKGGKFYAQFSVGGYRKVDDKIAMDLFKKAKKKMVAPEDVFDPFDWFNHW